MRVYDLNKLDGKEISPGVILIGSPSFHQESGKWRSLANVCGALCIVELSVVPVDMVAEVETKLDSARKQQEV